ncbi:hypothetical protein ACFL1B_01860 [Nanoarchaeota archaeon]
MSGLNLAMQRMNEHARIRAKKNPPVKKVTHTVTTTNIPVRTKEEKEVQGTPVDGTYSSGVPETDDTFYINALELVQMGVPQKTALEYASNPTKDVEAAIDAVNLLASGMGVEGGYALTLFEEAGQRGIDWLIDKHPSDVQNVAQLVSAEGIDSRAMWKSVVNGLQNENVDIVDMYLAIEKVRGQASYAQVPQNVMNSAVRKFIGNVAADRIRSKEGKRTLGAEIARVKDELGLNDAPAPAKYN